MRSDNGLGRTMDRIALIACAGIVVLPSLGMLVGASTAAAEGPPPAPTAQAIAQHTPGQLRRAPSPNAVQHAQQRSTPVMSAVRRADDRVRAGFDRAARGAHYSARAEFVGALRIIAAAYDADQKSQRFTQSLSAGLAALRESRDFLRGGPDHPELPIARIAAAHESRILAGSELHDIGHEAAAQRYREFAVGQLAGCAAGEPVGSLALFGLAKVAQVTSSGPGIHGSEHIDRAAALYRAALVANPTNFCAANELAVLISQRGHLEEARDLLIHSVKISPQATTWHNLSTVHARLGEVRLAEQAKAQAESLPPAQKPNSAPAVEWVDPQAFSQTNSATDATLATVPVAQTNPAAAGQATRQPTANSARKPPFDSFRRSLRR